MGEPKDVLGVIVECSICKSHEVHGLTVPREGGLIHVCGICMSLGLDQNEYQRNVPGDGDLAAAISLGIRGLHNRHDELTEMMEDSEEPSVTRALATARSRLRDACMRADAEEELSEHVDGSLLDAATTALQMASGPQEEGLAGSLAYALGGLFAACPQMEAPDSDYTLALEAARVALLKAATAGLDVGDADKDPENDCGAPLETT